MAKADFAPKDPDYAERAHASFARQGFMTLIGARLTRVEPGLVRIETPYRAELTQQHGYFHAGVTGAIADTAGGYAGFSLFPATSSVLTVEYKLNLIAPAEGETLVATGRVIKAGRTLTVCALEVVAVKGSVQTTCATGLQTLICLHDRPDTPAAG